jgi:opacity protein-like surface antigen
MHLDLATAQTQKIAPLNYVITLSGGPVWARTGGTQQLNLQPEVNNAYVANNGSLTSADGEIFLGLQHRFDSFLGQIGLSGGAISSSQLNGSVWIDADPNFINYTYQYKIKQARVALMAKFLADIGHTVQPYFSASAGVGFNRAYHFISTPTLYEALPMPAFSSNTTTSFAYTAGGGIQKIINQSWQIAIGYEYINWGKPELARAAGQTLGSGPVLNNIYSNGLIFSLSYTA